MNNQRLQYIVRQAQSLKARFDSLNRQWAARIAIMGSEPIGTKVERAIEDGTPHPAGKLRPKWVTDSIGHFEGKRVVNAAKPIHRSNLVPVTPDEHHWLLNNGFVNAARWTRPHDQQPEGWLEAEPFVQSRTPVVKEFLVGTLSMGCVASDSDEESDGLSKSAMAQEVASEMTDLLTILYQDPQGFEAWMKQAITDLIKKAKLDPRNPGYRAKARRQLLTELPCDETGEPLMVMVEDEETGEPRPIKLGDYVQTAWGSNEDLDALYLEEGDDPRAQHDVTNEGSDHRWSGRFRANTPLEEKFLHASCFSSPQGGPRIPEMFPSEPLNKPKAKPSKTRKNQRAVMPNSVPIMDDIRWQPTEQAMRRIADGIVERNKSPDSQVLPTIDAVENRLRNIAADLRMSDGGIDQGHFITKDEYFATLDHNQHLYERCVLTPQGTRIPGARPGPIDWDACHKAQEKLNAQPYQPTS